jgi:hypothetical protein
MRGSEMHTHEHAIAEPRIDRRECGDEQTDEEQDRKDRIAFQHVSDAGDEIIANRVKEMFPSKRK